MGNVTERDLLQEALNARERSYCPYSRYPVGAALLGRSGRLYRGANVEVASYGLSMCAERTALFSAVVRGEREFTKMAVVGSGSKRATPCGACRQVLHEFAPGLEIILGTGPEDLETVPLRELLPRAFLC